MKPEPRSMILDPAHLRLIDVDDALCLVNHEVRISDLSAVQCFPESDPGLWISLRTPDGNEVGLIPSLHELDPDSRLVLERRLRDRYHVPEITAIVRVDRGPEGIQCTIDTDEGEYVLLIRSESDTDTRNFPRVVLTDGPSSRRFRIPGYTTLDRTSQTLARQHLSIGRRGGRRHR